MKEFTDIPVLGPDGKPTNHFVRVSSREEPKTSTAPQELPKELQVDLSEEEQELMSEPAGSADPTSLLEPTPFKERCSSKSTSTWVEVKTAS